MSDISKCTGEGCTMKDTCYRFKAESCEFAQSYFTEPPHDGVDEDGNSKCEYYWETNKIKTKKLTIEEDMFDSEMLDVFKDRAKAYMSLKKSVVDRRTKKEEDEG